MLACNWSSRRAADKASERLPHTETLTGKIIVYWRNLACVGLGAHGRSQTDLTPLSLLQPNKIYLGFKKLCPLTRLIHPT